mgnify:CR=1 FL=1
MQKKKLVALLLVLGLLAPNCISLSAENKTKNNIKPVHQLKGGVSDYKIEYINADWWDNFDDPILKSYVIKALNANHGLKIATLKVAEYQALAREALGREFPVVGIGTNLSRQKTSDNVYMGKFHLSEYTQNAYSFPLTASYELDLWRKNRDRTLGALKELEAARYDEKAVYISLISAVATSYFNAIKMDKLIELQKDVIALREKILELTKERHDNGLCSTAEVIRADKALTEAKSGLNDLEKYRNTFLNQLAVLTGQSVENSLMLERASVDDLEPINNLPASIKSEVVLQRPDVLKAEAVLQKSRIDVKLARKDFLPSINITGQFGFNSNIFDKALNWDSYAASMGLGILENIFTGGQRHARLKARQMRYEQMLEAYKRSILQAFQEVTDSLVAIKYDTQKDNDNKSRLNFEKRNLELVNAKYEEGILSYLSTLEYKERELMLQQDRIQSKIACFIDAISLYKAVGGKL